MSDSNLHPLCSTDQLLRDRLRDSVVEPEAPRWEDVLARANAWERGGSGRRPGRRSIVAVALAVAVAAAAAAVVSPALGLGSSPIPFFRAKPATSSVRATFTRLAVLGLNSGSFTTSAPRQIYVFHLPSGDYPLSVAPVDTAAGQFCWTLSGVNDGCQTILSSHGPYKPGETDPMKIGLIHTDIPARNMKQTPVLIGGNVRAAGAEGMRVLFEDGAAAAVPLVWVSSPINAGFFLYELPHDRWASGQRPIAVEAVAADGHTLARVAFDVASTLRDAAGASGA